MPLPRCTVCDASKYRLFIFRPALAVLTFMICAVAWAHAALEDSLNLSSWGHMTLEASLNLLWVLLAAGAFVRWVKPSGRRRGHLPGLVSLVFALALLFPFISANDDLARLELINNIQTSQSISKSLKSDKQPCGLAELLSSPSASAAQLVPVPRFSFEFLSELTRATGIATPGEATGNHSPPRLLTFLTTSLV